MLLQSILAATDPSHVDYADLQNAVAKIVAVADNVRHALAVHTGRLRAHARALTADRGRCMGWARARR